MTCSRCRSSWYLHQEGDPFCTRCMKAAAEATRLAAWDCPPPGADLELWTAACEEVEALERRGLDYSDLRAALLACMPSSNTKAKQTMKKSSRSAFTREESTMNKPPHGEPCNLCGDCCRDQRCPFGAILFGPGPMCPALDPAGGCGLVSRPGDFATGDADHLREAASVMIGAGQGCDALLVGERPNLAFRARMLSWAARKRPAARRAMRLWSRSRR